MRVLVTGVSAGLGVETARALVERGAAVIGTARDMDKARQATGHIAGPGKLELAHCDLASLASVRACADALVAQGKRFDALLANAGVMACPEGRTVDGFETQFGTNHLGHFVLVNRLVSLMKPGGRIVIVASGGHRNSDVDLEDPDFETTPYEPLVAYGRSKTANVLFAVELDRRLRGKGIRAAAVHPGGIRTELLRHMSPEYLAAYAERTNKGLKPQPMKTPEQGAATTLWAGFRAPADLVGGRYCEDCEVSDVAETDPGIRKGVRPYAVDPQRARALWALSEAMVGETMAIEASA